MKEMIKNIPIIGSISRKIFRTLVKPKPFPGSEKYWIQRYNSGGNSGVGSYDRLAEFKAEIINDFVKRNNIKTLIEYGSGDGNQLTLAIYPSYIGYDISPKAITLCKNMFKNDKTKSFKLMKEYKGETAQLTLSLEVIFHLVENEIYYSYMERLFNSSERFVIIYSSNNDEEPKFHVRPRRFTDWIEINNPKWKLLSYIPNRFPYNINEETYSFSDFYIYEKV